MPNKSNLRVSNPPPKPLLIWDGDCDFCRLWIERWREMTMDKVDYSTYQKAADRFPEIPTDEFNRSLVLIQPDGAVLFAVEAVYRSLAYRRSREWLAWSYDHLPGFAGISETGYGLIARNRKFASAVTRVLWGKDVRRPTYFWAQRWFLRALGVIYLIAFVSLWVQVDGLVGSNGVSPVSQFLPAVRAQLGPDAYTLLPTLCWFGSSNAFLHFLCGSGVVCCCSFSESLRRFHCLLFSFCTCRSQSQDKSFSIFNGTCFCWRWVFYRSFSRRGGCGQGSCYCGHDHHRQPQPIRFRASVCFCSSFFCSN